MKQSERKILNIVRRQCRERTREYGSALLYLSRLNNPLFGGQVKERRDSKRIVKLAVKLGWVK